MLALSFSVRVLTAKSPVPTFVSRSGTPNTLSSYLILGITPTHLSFSSLRTFKYALSDEPLCHRSTSPTEPLYLFLTSNPLSKKSERKQPFDMIFINSRPLASNHTAKEVDLSFREYGCPVAVKLNRT